MPANPLPLGWTICIAVPFLDIHHFDLQAMASGAFQFSHVQRYSEASNNIVDSADVMGQLLGSRALRQLIPHPYVGIPVDRAMDVIYTAMPQGLHFTH